MGIIGRDEAEKARGQCSGTGSETFGQSFGSLITVPFETGTKSVFLL